MPELAGLEQRLSRLGAELDWPATPNLAPAVRLRIGARRPRFERRWLMAAAAAILVLAAIAAYPPGRDAIASWINLHTIFRTVPHLATPTPQPRGPLGPRLGLGAQTTLEEARAAVKWPLLVPASLGRPDEVYVQPPPDRPSGGEVTLVGTGKSLTAVVPNVPIGCLASLVDGQVV